MNKVIPGSSEIIAAPLEREMPLDAEHPSAAWERAQAVCFHRDWRGANPDPGRETRVRVLWSRNFLYLRFECRYRELFVFEDADEDGRHQQLWDRDVAEVFLQPDPSQAGHYKEFEVSPNGMWVDLDIFPGGRADLKSGMQRSVYLCEKRQTWAAELAIPIKTLAANFDSTAIWRVNFFRVEGSVEPRAYYSWQPTGTPNPDFHVPESFGTLRFAVALP